MIKKCSILKYVKFKLEQTRDKNCSILEYVNENLVYEWEYFALDFNFWIFLLIFLYQSFK